MSLNVEIHLNAEFNQKVFRSAKLQRIMDRIAFGILICEQAVPYAASYDQVRCLVYEMNWYREVWSQIERSLPGGGVSTLHGSKITKLLQEFPLPTHPGEKRAYLTVKELIFHAFVLEKEDTDADHARN